MVASVTTGASIATLALAEPAHASGDCQSRDALNHLLASPTNLEAAVAHAQCAIDEGNIESAVATFEALLIYTPENAQLELDLADLYARLGSVELARLHYENVLEGGGLSDDLRLRAQSGLADLSSISGGDSFSFSHFAAWRWQDNANLGLSSASLIVGSTLVTVPNNQQKKVDHSMWHEGGLSARFGGDGGDGGGGGGGELLNSINAWQLDVDWFGNWQDKGKPLDSILVSAEFGPEFGLTSHTTTLRPYLALSYAELENKPLYWSWGGGVHAFQEINDQLLWESKLDLTTYRYDDNSLRSLSGSYNGEQYSATSSLTYLVSDSLQLTANTNLTYADLVDDQYSYLGSGVSISALVDTGINPLDAGSVVLDLSAGFESRDYLDPSTSAPFVTKADEQWSLGLEVDLPMAESVSLVSRIEFDSVTSNDPFSGYEALSTYLGVRVNR